MKRSAFAFAVDGTRVRRPIEPTLRQRIGCWLHERPATEVVLLAGWLGLKQPSWLDLRNRKERVEEGDLGARMCLWRDSSFLTVARFYPRVGARLLRHCADQWPFALTNAPLRVGLSPRVSVVLPVGGMDRLPHLRTVLRAWWAQSEEALDLIVAEHAQSPILAAYCPPSVRHVHVPRRAEEQFNRGKAFNAGARVARAPVLLFQDADLVPPRDYARVVLERLDAGFDASLPLRFIFHLDETATRAFTDFECVRLPREVQHIHQNATGGAVAVRRAVHDSLGGHDEAFEGWGGEDVEFLDRLRTTKLLRGGYVPAIHLWHPAAPKKASGHRNHELMLERLAVPAEERIRRLVSEQLA